MYNAYLKNTHDHLLSKIDLSQHSSVLDVSAGTGLLAEELILKFGPFDQLVLNDPSTKMLEVAEKRLKTHNNIEFAGFFAEKLNFPENTFDHIICLNSFHYYADQERAMKQLKKVLKPDGTLWVQDWDRVGAFRIAIKLIDWLSPENINVRSLNEMKILLDDHDFSIVEQNQWRFRWWNFFFIRADLKK